MQCQMTIIKDQRVPSYFGDSFVDPMGACMGLYLSSMKTCLTVCGRDTLTSDKSIGQRLLPVPISEICFYVSNTNLGFHKLTKLANRIAKLVTPVSIEPEISAIQA